MGTAVLFPQDCLRPRSRHKHQSSGMIYPPEYAPRLKRIPLPPAQSQEAGLLPLPGHSGRSLPVTIPRRGSDTNHFKSRKDAEQRDSNPSSRAVSDAPVYKILQRPKQRDAAVNLLAQFVMLDEVEAGSVMVVAENASIKRLQKDGPEGADKCNSYVKAQYGTLDNTSDGFKLKHKGSDTKVVKVCIEELPGTKVGALKPKNVIADKVQSGPDDSVRRPPPRVAPKPLMTKATGKANDTSCKAVIVHHSEERDSVLPRLRRTSTEPQINTHLLGHYRSKVMHISFDNSKSESHAHGRGFSVNTTSLSCQERWAGPAYTSSPSPSSLPLPKLCLPHSRFSSLEVPPLVKQYSSSVYMQPFLGSSAPSKNEGAWDVAFATKNLRKMLNLDPC